MRRILAFLLYAALATNAWATSQPISVLPSASALSGSELSYCVQGAGDAKCLASQYATYVLGTYVPGFPLTITGGTSGGIPFFSANTTLTSSSALTINLPMFGGGAGAAPFVGTRSGNTTKVVTTTGSLPNGDCAQWDANGNAIDSGSVCGGGGGGLPSTGGTAGKWYLPFAIMPSSSAGVAVAANKIVCEFGAVPQKGTVDQLGVTLTTVDSGGNTQLAIYATGSDGLPAALIGATGSISVTSGTTLNAVFASSATYQIGPGGTAGNGNLWWCQNNDNATAVFVPATALIGVSASFVGSATQANVASASAFVNGLSCATTNCEGGSSTFNTWPSTLHGSTWTDTNGRNVPIINYHYTSIP